MSGFICPVCGNVLIKKESSYICDKKHCFDISRKGVVNLLRSNTSRHGDDKLMVRARSSFLNKGYYLPLLNILNKRLSEAAHDGCVILDCGCGECWYTASFYDELRKNGINADFYGIDVSKEALAAGAGRCKALNLAVASVYDVPMADSSCDIIISLFAPFAPDEYRRLLRKNGVFITAFPMTEHLWELKQAVYDEPYKNEPSDTEIAGFKLISSDIVREVINICTNEDIISLFSMTPYYYKTSQKDRQKLDSLSSLETQIHFCVAVYRLI